MALQKLQFRPGIVKDLTSYSNEGGWNDGDKIRFRLGVVERIGGWTKVLDGTSFAGTCRILFPFVSLSGEQYVTIGTNEKLYLDDGGTLLDITPLRLTSSAGDVTFSASASSSTVTVSHTGHGANEGDYVTFSGAVSLGGQVTADVLNTEYKIASVTDASTYTITVPVTADGSDTGNGGASVVGAYQISIGLPDTTQGTGWGAGAWNTGAWNEPSLASDISLAMRLWSTDNFGEDLISNIYDGDIYYWDTSVATGTEPVGRAVALSDLAGADPGTPTVARKVIVSDRDRHIIVFGCDPFDDVGVQDPLLIRFSSQESPTTWDPTVANTAGDIRVGSGSEIITAVETRQQILVFTDSSLHAMRYLGPPFTFGIEQISRNTTIVGPNTVVAVDDMVFWMGVDNFYGYTGQVQKLPCPVRDFIFGDFNDFQRQKCFAASNSSFNEVWWFYPTADSDEVDRYVIYNYTENTWSIGTLSRTAWADRGTTGYPIAASTDGNYYFHEFGLDDGEQNPPGPVNCFIESSQMDVGDGDHFVAISRIIPDITFAGSTQETPEVNFTVKTRNYPGGAYLQEDEATVTRTATTPVQKFTRQLDVRVRGRSFAMRVESDQTGTNWKLGSPRVDMRPDGRR